MKPRRETIHPSAIFVPEERTHLGVGVLGEARVEDTVRDLWLVWEGEVGQRTSLRRSS